MGNEPEDHRILGQLSLELAEAINGLIDLHGPLPGSAIQGLRGTVLPREVELAIGSTATHHLIDAAFMRNYLQHPDFKMAD